MNPKLVMLVGAVAAVLVIGSGEAGANRLPLADVIFAATHPLETVDDLVVGVEVSLHCQDFCADCAAYAEAFDCYDWACGHDRNNDCKCVLYGCNWP